jgi:hypothetical protein
MTYDNRQVISQYTLLDGQEHEGLCGLSAPEVDSLASPSPTFGAEASGILFGYDVVDWDSLSDRLLMGSSVQTSEGLPATDRLSWVRLHGL